MKPFTNLALALTVSLCALGADSAQTIVEYGKYNGGALQMVVEDGGRIILRVALGTATEKIDRLDRVRADYFLGKEVERLTSQGKATALGESAYQFIWESGYPFNGPQQQVSKGILYESLWFGENAQVLGREIKGKGRDMRDLPAGGGPPQKVIVYGRYNGGDLQMVVDNGSRVVIRLDIGEATKKDPSYLWQADKFLEREVTRLTSGIPDIPIALGQSGYQFAYQGGFPIGAPHEEISDGTIWKCRWFAEKAEIVGREIRASGTEHSVVRTYPIPGNVCSDQEKTLASVPHDLFLQLKQALIFQNFEEAIRIADSPGSGMKAARLSKDAHGNIIGILIMNKDGCTVAMARTSRDYFRPRQ